MTSLESIIHAFVSASSALNADIHVYRAGKVYVNIRVSDDGDVAKLSKELGVPQPRLRFHDGHEWTESICDVGEARVSLTSEHRQRCKCKGS